jgi:ribosomal protein L13
LGFSLDQKQKNLVGVVLLSVNKTTTTTTTPPHHTGMITFKATSRQPRKLIFGMQPYSNPTRRNMENDLNIFENGGRPQFNFF